MSTFANVNVGSTANDHTGDPLRNSFIKINQNFANIAGGNAGGVTSVAGRVGNVVLSVNDVQGAANVYFVTSTVAAGNAYVDAAVASLGSIDVVTLTSTVNAIDANVGVATNNIVALTANASTQATAINTLTTNAAIQAASINSLISNAITQATSINNLTNNISGFDTSIGDLTANSASLAAQIDVLTANAATQSNELASVRANIVAANASISTLTTNAATQSTSINTLLANAALQHNNIVTLTANSATQSLAIDLLIANTGVQTNGINLINANVGAFQLYANANLSAHSVFISELTANAAAQGGSINVLIANAATQYNSIAGLLANATAQSLAINQLASDIDANLQTLTASIEAYQTYANANATSQTASINLLTTNAAAQATSINNLTSSKASLAGAKFTGNIVIDSGASTLNSRTGGLVVTGAAGVAVGGNVNIESMLFVGVDAQSPFLHGPITIERSTSTSGAGTQYTQHAIINATATGSSDFIAYPNNYPGFGNDHGWVDLGVAGAEFDDPLYTITRPNDCYLFASAPSFVGAGGNLVLATDSTGTFNDVIIATSGFHTSNEIARFHANGTTRLTVQGNITADNIVVDSVTVTDDFFWANGVSYAQTLGNTGNITFSDYTISTVDAIGSAGITITPANGGEIHIDSYTGINNSNPGYWVHVGDGSIGAVNNTGNISVDFNDGTDTYRASTILDYAWWNGASQGNDNRGTGPHKHFGIYKNDDTHATAYVEWDLASGNTTMTNVAATRITTATALFGQITLISALQFANLTTAQITSIATPARGMTVYNYNTGNIQVYNGTKWANITLS